MVQKGGWYLHDALQEQPWLQSVDPRQIRPLGLLGRQGIDIVPAGGVLLLLLLLLMLFVLPNGRRCERDAVHNLAEVVAGSCRFWAGQQIDGLDKHGRAGRTIVRLVDGLRGPGKNKPAH